MQLIENKPILLDINCGAGGASHGYHEAGFFIIGFDAETQPNYEYTMAHAIIDTVSSILGMLSSNPLVIRSQDEHYSIGRNDIAAIHMRVDGSAQSISMARVMLAKTGRPYVIESESPIKRKKTLILEGKMLGLHPREKDGQFIHGIKMRRYYESSIEIIPPKRSEYKGTIKGGEYITTSFGKKEKLDDLRRAIEVEWMNKRPVDRGLKGAKGNWQDVMHCTPPVYTRFIGEQIMQLYRNNKD